MSRNSGRFPPTRTVFPTSSHARSSSFPILRTAMHKPSVSGPIRDELLLQQLSGVETYGTTSTERNVQAAGDFLKGLFFGPGASRELGMPLVWELTAELRHHITPSVLRTVSQMANQLSLDAA